MPTSRNGEAVEVLQMAVEDQCEHDMLVQIRWQGRKMAVPLSQLSAIDQTNQPTRPSAAGVTGSLGATASSLWPVNYRKLTIFNEPSQFLLTSDPR